MCATRPSPGRETSRSGATVTSFFFPSKDIKYFGSVRVCVCVAECHLWRQWQEQSESCGYEPSGGVRVPNTSHLRSAQPSAEKQTPHRSCQRGLAQPLHRRCVSVILTWVPCCKAEGFDWETVAANTASIWPSDGTNIKKCVHLSHKWYICKHMSADWRPTRQTTLVVLFSVLWRSQGHSAG